MQLLRKSWKFGT